MTTANQRTTDLHIGEMFEFNSCVMESAPKTELKFAGDSAATYTVSFKFPKAFQGTFNDRLRYMRDETSSDMATVIDVKDGKSGKQSWDAYGDYNTKFFEQPAAPDKDPNKSMARADTYSAYRISAHKEDDLRPNSLNSIYKKSHASTTVGWNGEKWSQATPKYSEFNHSISRETLVSLIFAIYGSDDSTGESYWYPELIFTPLHPNGRIHMQTCISQAAYPILCPYGPMKVDSFPAILALSVFIRCIAPRLIPILPHATIPFDFMDTLLTREPSRTNRCSLRSRHPLSGSRHLPTVINGALADNACSCAAGSPFCGMQWSPIRTTLS